MRSIAAFITRIEAPMSIAMVLLIGLANPASAAGFTDFLNNVVDEFNNARRPLALIAIMVVGCLYMFNVIDMRRTGQVCVGQVHADQSRGDQVRFAQVSTGQIHVFQDRAAQVSAAQVSVIQSRVVQVSVT